MARQIFNAAGYGFDYQTVSWARCIDDARHGRFSGIIGAIPSDAPDFTFPEQPVGMSSNGFAFRRGEHFHYDGPQSLNGRVLGLVRGYSYSGPLGDYIRAHDRDPSRVEYVSGNGVLDKNLEKLVAGRIDVVLDDWNVLRNLVSTMRLQNRVNVDYGGEPTPIFIALSPLAPDPQRLAKILDAGVERLRASGRLASLLAQYHITDWH